MGLDNISFCEWQYYADILIMLYKWVDLVI